MKSFWFGGQTGERVKIEALSLKKAIRIFRVGTPFPHTYSSKRIRTTTPGRHGYEESVYLSSEPEGVIEVWTLHESPCLSSPYVPFRQGLSVLKRSSTGPLQLESCGDSYGHP